MRKVWLFAACGIAATTCLLVWLAHFPGLLEPDRLYHFALLREAVQQHSLAPSTWAQFPLLGWQNYFADKEFLFHLLLQIPYRLGGERVTLITALLFSALTIWLPFLAFPRARWFALALSVSLFLLHPHLLFRFSLVRPHTLAALLFTIFLFAYYQRKPRIAAVSLLLFPLAYHAVYVPLFVLGAALIIPLVLRERDHVRPLFWLFCAAAVGLVINPYFPGNLSLGLQHLALSFRTAEIQQALHLNFGDELLPPDPWMYLRTWSGVFISLLLAFAATAEGLRRGMRPTREILVLGFCSAVFFAAGFRSLRILEFAAPVWILFLCASLAGRRRWQEVVLFTLIVCQLPGLLPFLRRTLHPTDPYLAPPVAELGNLLEPLANEQVRIFHDNWGLGPYVTYLLPNAQAVDALDPTFLLLANPALAGLRVALVEGRVHKPVEAIREAFGADYALCEPSALQMQLLHAPGVKLLGVTSDKRFALFQLPQ